MHNNLRDPLSKKKRLNISDTSDYAENSIVNISMTAIQVNRILTYNDIECMTIYFGNVLFEPYENTFEFDINQYTNIMNLLYEFIFEIL